MATNKNQHFVPRCYLRPFTIAGAGAAINLYNIDRLRFIERAPVKNQCSGDYFYGKDADLESAIQSVESAYGNVLRKVLSPSYRLLDEHRHLIKLFWLLQHLRTEAASQRAVEMNEGMRAVIGATESQFRIEIRDAVQTAMKTFADSRDAVSDLKACLVRNRTHVPLITSDDPAVLTNRWQMGSAKAKGQSFGVHSGGALLLLPLSPQVLFLGYDGDVYSIPHENGWTEVRRDADVEALNEHQFLGCRANVFVREDSHSALVHDAFLKASSRRPVKRHVIHYAVFDRSEGDSSRFKVVDPAKAEDHERALVHMQVVHPEPATWPSLISWRPKGVVFSNGTGVGYVRRAWTYHRGGSPFRKEYAHGR